MKIKSFSKEMMEGMKLDVALLNELKKYSKDNMAFFYNMLKSDYEDWNIVKRKWWIGFLFTLAIILYVAVWFIPSTAYHLDFFILTPRFTVGLLSGILLLGLWWYFFGILNDKNAIKHALNVMELVLNNK
jgi:hypothetical protein